jgi:hypothetical protein
MQMVKDSHRCLAMHASHTHQDWHQQKADG